MFDGTGNQAITGTFASQTFYNIKVDKVSGTLSVGGSTTALTVNDMTVAGGNFTAPATFNIDGNVTLSGGAFTAGANIYVKGNWTNNGAVFAPGSGIVIFDGDNQSIGGTSTPLLFKNLVINSTVNSTLNDNATLSGYLHVNDASSFFIAPGKTLTVGGQ
jgi:hypothetical protein